MFQKISETIKENGENLGNKGLFLCRMKEAGFPVPDGVILDCEEYQKFLSTNNLDLEFKKILENLNEDTIQSTSEQIQSLFAGTRLPQDTRMQLMEKIDKGEYYAVRSSGKKEDLQEYSFAGQYDTYLNVQGMEALEEAIIGCYQSMFSEVLLHYLVNNQLNSDELAMAVVVQKMVPADYSGICFTVNPITGNDKEMSIEIAEGLGENIVSGKVEPQEYAYNWYEKKVVRGQSFFSDREIADFGEIFLKVQMLFGYPCDIEFAICDGQLYLLQARRITKLNYGMYKDTWSTADFKDGGVSASVCTPYMWSLYEYIWEFTLRKFVIDSKILTEKEADTKLGEMFYGRCYWNVNAVKLAMSRVIGYKEREFDSEYGVRITYEGDGETTKLTPKSLVAIIRMALAQRKILKERNDNCESYKEDLLNQYFQYKDKYDNHKITDIKKEWYQLTKQTYLQSESTYFWQIFINTVHQSLYKDSLLKYVSESEYLTLLGTINNISHLLPFYDMWEISREIRQDEKLLDFWKRATKDELRKRIEDNESYGVTKKIHGLIQHYGYHSDKELDVTYPCYYEDTMPLISNIRDMVFLGDEFGPYADKEKGEEKYLAILGKIKENVGAGKYKKIQKKIGNMRNMLWWREEYRDISTRFYYIIRVYTMALAQQLVREQVLETADDIWYLKVSTLWEYLDGKMGKEELDERIVRNREYYRAYANYMSENEIGGGFVTDKEEGEYRESSSDAKIQGLGANSGVVTGRARVIESFDEIGRLEENDILITRFTDTGWTPKFAILSGIVTEYGGILCHAAIVSREYGIPAIVNCHDAMKKIRDGQQITINGATGIVTIEE